MNYQEAKDALLAYKFVTRACDKWKNEVGYLVFLPGLTHFLRANLVPTPNVIPWAANIEDSHAHDWEIVEPACLKLPEEVKEVA